MAAAENDLYIKMGRPHNTCEACGTLITQAGKHPSMLRKAGAGAAGNAGQDGPRREDYCTACWQQLADRDFVGYWVTRREAPKVRKIESRKERNAALVAWFEHLRLQPQHEETRQSQFFLSHLLMKYGVFKWVRTESRPDGSEMVTFRQVGSDDEFLVPVVEFTDERSVEIKRELDEFLLQYANAQSAVPDQVSPGATGDEATDEL